jgi:hypothetical protein
MAASHDVHDYSCVVVGLFFGWLHHLSRSSRREIFGIYRLDRRRLLPDTGFARSACFCDVASGDFDACPGFSPPMGPAQANRTMDDPDLALRLDHRGVCVFDALQMVSSGERVGTPRCGVRSAQRADPTTSNPRRQGCLRHTQSCARQLFDV